MRKLQLAFSKKEKGEQLLARLEELNDAGEVSEEQYTSKKEQYTQLIQEGASEIEAVRTSLATKVEALKRDLEKYPQELEDLELKSKLGEIEAESYARREQRIRAKIERIEKDLKENEDLLDAETAEDAGGFIEIKLEKRGLLRRPDWL
ncbi:CdvA-like protein [Candidatus Bipolaricaulota bacterium]|nr:CdvA-like protein [Candidatus Bipolaricaulota bacterium]